MDVLFFICSPLSGCIFSPAGSEHSEAARVLWRDNGHRDTLTLVKARLASNMFICGMDHVSRRGMHVIHIFSAWLGVNRGPLEHVSLETLKHVDKQELHMTTEFQSDHGSKVF